jgi:type IV pilus assembly protein PilN
MYNFDINFLEDRTSQEEIAKGTLSKKTIGRDESKIPLYIGGAILAALPLIALTLLFLTNKQKNEITAQISKIDAEIAQLQAQNTQLTDLQAQLTSTKESRQALVSVFNQIKPVSVVLQDISDQAPIGIQIDSIKQTTAAQEASPSAIPLVNITITGIARSYNEVNDFVLTLQRSDFLNKRRTRIVSTQETPNPNKIENLDGENQENVTVELPQVVRFAIETQLNDVPASELLPQLTNKGATGLVTRINTLKEKGAIEP